MRKLLLIFGILIPFFASAQKELFMREFNEVNSWFFLQPEVMLTQKYTYYKDSSLAQPVDSSVIKIVKNRSAIHYLMTGVESFSDSGFMIKIRNDEKKIYVSRTLKSDTAQLRQIFNDAFSGFHKFTKTAQGKELSCWELSEGVAGVTSAKLVMDLKKYKIKYLLMYMSSGNEIISAYKDPNAESEPLVILRVDYQYENKIVKEPSLSDYIVIKGESISVSEKYKDYQLKLYQKTNEN